MELAQLLDIETSLLIEVPTLKFRHLAMMELRFVTKCPKSMEDGAGV